MMDSIRTTRNPASEFAQVCVNIVDNQTGDFYDDKAIFYDTHAGFANTGWRRHGCVG